MVFFAKVTCLDISEQEPRRAVEGIFSPSPQPEDPGRALDPGLKEDPDIIVELVNGVFYQASWEGASVAITADYLGLLPVSRVSRTEKNLSPEEDSPQALCFTLKASCYLQRRRSERGAEPLGTRRTWASGSGRLKRKVVRVETPLQR